jgi:hypothetical protein
MSDNAPRFVRQLLYEAAKDRLSRQLDGVPANPEMQRQVANVERLQAMHKVALGLRTLGV